MPAVSSNDQEQMTELMTSAQPTAMKDVPENALQSNKDTVGQNLPTATSKPFTSSSYRSVGL